MMKRLIGAGFVGAMFVCLAGCDDTSSTLPPAVLEQASKPANTGPKPPTTQELLTGHRSRTVLAPLPLTMELPPGWVRDPEAPAPNLLDAPLPSGAEVQLQLRPRPSMKQDELDRLMVAAKKEMAEKPQEIVKLDLRPMGSVRVLERQRVGPPGPLTTYDANNVPHTSTESNFNWTLSVLAPFEGAFQVYELNFIGLTKSQYEKDRDFLLSVLATLQYAADGGVSTSQPTTSGI